MTPDVFDPVTCIMSGAAPLPQADIDKLFDKAKVLIDTSKMSVSAGSLSSVTNIGLIYRHKPLEMRGN